MQVPKLPVPAVYAPLHKYLEGRFADTVVLTLAEIEDLLGSKLPEAAGLTADWWANEGATATPSPQSLSWIRASRVASVNLRARSVRFERA